MALPQILPKPTIPSNQYVSFANPNQASANYANYLASLPQPAPAAPQTQAPAPAQPDPIATAIAQQQAADARKEADRIAGIQRQVQVGQEGIQTGGQTQLRDIGNAYATNTRNTAQSIAQSQQGINTARENTALNLRRGMAGVVDSLRQGLRSGNVQLSNMGASDSGAAQALARAYARQGNRQAADVRNQAFMQGRETDTQQSQLNQQEQNAVSDFATYRSTEMDRISNDLYNQLRVLDANASAEGVNGKVDFSIRDRLINEAIARLNQIDQQFSQQLAGTNPLSQEQINANALSLDQAGASGGNPFGFTPASLQITPQATATGIPLYRRPDQNQQGF